MRFCYIDVANITRIFQKTKVVNGICLIFNADFLFLTFVSNFFFVFLTNRALQGIFSFLFFFVERFSIKWLPVLQSSEQRHGG